MVGFRIVATMRKGPCAVRRTAAGKDPLSRYAAHLVVTDERPALRGKQGQAIARARGSPRAAVAG